MNCIDTDLSSAREIKNLNCFPSFCFQQNYSYKEQYIEGTINSIPN